MFTLENIKAAHIKVKSGSDFPQYVQELKALGVISYSTLVDNGQVKYNSLTGESLITQAQYPKLLVAHTSSPQPFIEALKKHQAGQSDYMAFCRDCAQYGIKKWLVNLETFECIYYDCLDKEILRESIPH